MDFYSSNGYYYWCHSIYYCNNQSYSIVFGLIALGLTISLAPIFIPFILFKYTKTLFDAWIKQLMILITQPLFILQLYHYLD